MDTTDLEEQTVNDVAQQLGAGTERSRRLFEEARQVIPGGVSSPVRAFAAVGGTPRFMARGRGASVWDVDGNEYIDWVMSWGPLIHGHAFEPVVRAVATAAQSGTSFGTPTVDEIRLAQMVANAVTSVDMVRFVSSGTEATMSAIRLARGATGRDLIVKFAGNYHGHSDALLVQAGSGALTLGVPSSPGVPDGTAASTLVAPYNDADALRTLFSERGDEIAAVIVEPVAGNMGVVSPELQFLPTIQALCRDAGALFICDEVITGFRIALGGAQEVFEIHPDLTTFGKILGGGLPVGAYGGRRTIMEQVAPSGPIYQAGTLSGNPITTAAGIANMEPLLDPAFYRRLGATTEALASGLREAALSAGIPCTINVQRGMLTVFFADGPVTDLVSAQRSDTGRYRRFFHGMLDQGVYLPPSQFEAWMISSSHGAAEVERTVAAARRAFALAAP